MGRAELRDLDFLRLLRDRRGPIELSSVGESDIESDFELIESELSEIAREPLVLSPPIPPFEALRPQLPPPVPFEALPRLEPPPVPFEALPRLEPPPAPIEEETRELVAERPEFKSGDPRRFEIELERKERERELEDIRDDESLDRFEEEISRIDPDIVDIRGDESLDRFEEEISRIDTEIAALKEEEKGPEDREERKIPESEVKFLEKLIEAEERLKRRDPDELAVITSRKIRDLSFLPFSTPTFNEKIIEKTIRRQISASGDVIDEDRLFVQVRDILAKGVAEALESKNSEANLLGVFSSLAQAIRNIGGDINDPDNVSNLLDRAAFSLVGRQGLEDLTFIPQQDPATNVAIAALFGDDLALAVNRPNISVAQVQEIARDFNNELVDFIESGLVDKSTFKNIVNWIDKHIANADLKAALRSQARKFDIELQRIESDQQLQGVPELIPLAQGRGILLDRDIAIDFSNELNRSIAIIAELPQDQVGPKLLELLDVTNGVLRNLNIHAIRNGRNIIPTITRTKIDGSMKNPIEIVNELLALAQELPSPVSKFTFLPIIAEGQPLNIDEIVRDLISRFKKQRSKAIRAKSARKMISHPSKRSNFGKVVIHTTRSESGGNEFEIIIEPNAKLEDILKIVAAVLVEDGQLRDVDGKVLLHITKNITPKSEVLAVIRKEQKSMMGVKVHLSYKPTDPVGGSFLGGALSALLKRPFRMARIPPSGIPKIDNRAILLNTPFHNLHQPVGGRLQLPIDSAGAFGIQVTPESRIRLEEQNFRSESDEDQIVGGSIFGDIFKTIGNVAKTVASVPLALTGAVFGGELPNTTQVLESDLDERRSVTAY